MVGPSFMSTAYKEKEVDSVGMAAKNLHPHPDVIAAAMQEGCKTIILKPYTIFYNRAG